MVLQKQSTQRNKPLREYYDSVKNEKESGKFAHVSTMRKLPRMIYYMLKKNQPYDSYERPDRS